MNRIKDLDPRIIEIAEKIYKMEVEYYNKKHEEEERIAAIVGTELARTFGTRHAESEVCKDCSKECPLSLQFKRIHYGFCKEYSIVL